MDALEQNARDLERELAWLARVLDRRFKLTFGHDDPLGPVTELEPPAHEAGTSPFADFIHERALDFGERVASILALTPILRPQLLDLFFTKNAMFDRRFTEFGGMHDASSGFVPTGDTLAFVVGGSDLVARLRVRAMLSDERRVPWLDLGRITDGAHDELMAAPLRPTSEWLGRVTDGALQRPRLDAGFPARRITTELSWDDLVLHPGTRRQIDEIMLWLEHGETLMREWGMSAKLRPGHRALFYGPPGTGKSMTACLLGASTGREVHRVDLSLVVSKYVGETEKNLARVFDRAQRCGWILFFDEADALFGKRSETRSAHDRYANQEVAYLLQRIESFDGVVILASNLRENLDAAFARRFESIVHFPMPRPAERLQLWSRGFSDRASFADDVTLDQVARSYELSGGSIMNVIRHVSLHALAGERAISKVDLERGARMELGKVGSG